MKLCRRITAVALLLCFFRASAADNIRIIHESDPHMNMAIGRAKQTLDEFFRIHKNPPANASSFVLKVLFSSNSSGEHMWVFPFFQKEDGTYAGMLKSVPQYLKSLQWGQEVVFTKDQISDWGYVVSGRRRGYFTTCALFIKDPTLKMRVESDGIPYACAL